jgi:hypothetical protein
MTAIPRSSREVYGKGRANLADRFLESHEEGNERSAVADYSPERLARELTP